jgi:hypothetical protein
MSTNPYQMLIRGTANAPKFDGTIVDISRYFDDFNQHADSMNLMLKPRIKAALRYISWDDAETWETLTEASGDDYAAFVKAVKEQLYPGCDETSGKRVFAILAFIAISAIMTVMTVMTRINWINYYNISK